MSQRIESIDVISDAFFPDWIGGLQRYATEFSHGLSQRGHRVHLWTREWTPNGRDLIRRSIDLDQVSIILSRLPVRIRGAVIVLLSLFNFPLHRFLKGDIRVAHSSILGNLFLTSKSRVPQIYVFHASPSLEIRSQLEATGKNDLVKRLRGAVLRVLERRCLKKADAIVVLSSFSKAILLREFPQVDPSSIRLIPGGSQVQVQNGTSAKRAKRIVALRRLEWRTGVDLLLDAFATSEARNRGWMLDVVGSGSLEAALRGRVKTLGIEDSVVFHGRVSEEDRQRLLEAATLTVLPTRAYEGFGLATVEAMAHGVVPIVTSIGASPEIVNQVDPQLVFEATADSLAAGLDYWTHAEQSERLAHYSSRCLTVARTFDWSHVLNAYEELARTLSRKSPF